MNKLLFLFAVVAVTAAMPVDSDANLLKRLLDVLKETKRATNFISFDSSTSELTVSYIARIGATGVSHHSAHVTDSAGGPVGTFTSTEYTANGGGVTNTYTLSGLTSGATYTVKACEVNDDGSTAQCNTKTFTA